MTFLTLVFAFLFFLEWQRNRKLRKLIPRQVKVSGRVRAEVEAPQVPRSFIAALKSLGVNKEEAISLWVKVDNKATLETQVSQALKQLGKDR